VCMNPNVAQIVAFCNRAAFDMGHETTRWSGRATWRARATQMITAEEMGLAV
jgi:hypothetical protein